MIMYSAEASSPYKRVHCFSSDNPLSQEDRKDLEGLEKSQKTSQIYLSNSQQKVTEYKNDLVNTRQKEKQMINEKDEILEKIKNNKLENKNLKTKIEEMMDEFEKNEVEREKLEEQLKMNEAFIKSSNDNCSNIESALAKEYANIKEQSAKIEEYEKKRLKINEHYKKQKEKGKVILTNSEKKHVRQLKKF